MKKYNKIFEEINLNLIKNINKIKHKKNKLECICLNICSKDCDDFNNLREQIIANTNLIFSKKINFIIVKNKNFYIDTKFLEKIFKKVEIFNLNLEPKDDLYIPYKLQHIYVNKKIAIPEYGTKSGPNIMFFKSMDLLKNYNTSLLLETDCLLSNDWLERIIKYVRYCNGFWISGATYDGGMYTCDELMLNHINGLALYATGNKYFQIFMDCFEKYLKYSIKNKDPFLAYDWGIKCFIKENLEMENNHLFWKFVKRNYVVNNLIFNYCPSHDVDFDEKSIMKIYNYAILHKKIK